MRILWIVTALLLGPLTAHGDEATTNQGTLEIRITNIEKGSGTIYIAILNSAEGWLKSDSSTKPFRDIIQVVSSTDDLQIVVQDLPSGTYAISLFHDLDGDAALDTNFVGFPKEPFGFSAPMGKFGPPKFEKAAIEFSGENVSIEVALNQ